MGFIFGRKSKPRKAIETAADLRDAEQLHGPASDALRSMMLSVLTKGSFLQSLTDQPGFKMNTTHDGLEIAEQSDRSITCVMADRVAGFSVDGVDPGYLASMIVDPTLLPILGKSPEWNSDTPVGDVWTARMSSNLGLVVLLECKERAVDPTVTSAENFGSTLTIQLMTQH